MWGLGDPFFFLIAGSVASLNAVKNDPVWREKQTMQKGSKIKHFEKGGEEGIQCTRVVGPRMQLGRLF